MREVRGTVVGGGVGGRGTVSLLLIVRKTDNSLVRVIEIIYKTQKQIFRV